MIRFRVHYLIRRYTNFLNYEFFEIRIFSIYRFTEKFLEAYFTDLIHGNWVKTVIYASFEVLYYSMK